MGRNWGRTIYSDKKKYETLKPNKLEISATDYWNRKSKKGLNEKEQKFVDTYALKLIRRTRLEGGIFLSMLLYQAFI